jgi:tetratricopeptide (TPR) repeat protein
MLKLAVRTTLLVVSLCTWLAPAYAAEPAGPGSYKAWQLHRDEVLKTPGVVRYYTFQQASDAPLANMAEAKAPLTLRAVKGKSGDLNWVEGRWPEKAAVRLDQDYLAAEPLPITKAFTVAAWLSTHGMGAIHGDSVATGGTLFSVGSGFWDGCRVTLRYPDQMLGFEIGRPKPSHSIGIGGGPLVDDAWHHLVASWDGKTMRLHVDGRLIASGPFDGVYTPSPSGAAFRIGFAGFGWGSAVLDVDEVTVYNRALSADEIVRLAHFHAPLDQAMAARFGQAERLVEAKDFASAQREYETIVENKYLHPDYHAFARLCLARMYQQQKKGPAALREFARVAELTDVAPAQTQTALIATLQLMTETGTAPAPKVLEKMLTLPGLSARQRAVVSLQLARKHRDAGDLSAARIQYLKALTIAELSPREKLDAQLEMAHVCFAAKEFATARTEYAKVLMDLEAPGHYKSQAQLQVAASHVRENDLSAARVEYAKLATLSNAPVHHRWEAQECLRELARVAAGQPARDPAASRTTLPRQPRTAANLYIAPNGSDTNPGTKDRPLASLEKARDLIRDYRRRLGLPRDGVTVYLRDGEYPRRATFQLAAQDSGTAESPIVYRAYPAESARLYGGVRLTGLAPVTDPAILARLPEAARGKVLQVDLHTVGVTEYSRSVPRVGHGPQPVMELFCNRKPLTLARWPNEGFVRIEKVIQQGSPTEKRGFVFEYEGDRPTGWPQKDVWLYGYFQHLWADTALSVASLDTKTRQITMAAMGPFEVHEAYPYYAFNLLEELDLPGEWFLDQSTGMLYVYPPADPKQAVFELSVLGAPLVQIDKASHVTIRNLVLELGQTDGLVIRGGDHCRVASCTVRHLGGTAVAIDGGVSHGILGCDLYTLGRGGTSVTGGDRKTLAPGGHVVENCHIYDFSRVYRTYTPAVQLNGVGNRVAHNLFHDSPGHAMRVEGNDHTIELNEIHHVVLETDDQGGLDMWFNPTYRGNVIRWNYWHDIASGRPCGQAGVRLDDAISGTLIYGNIFERCADGNFGGVQIHGGKENVVDNNLFVDCLQAVSFSPWGSKRWKEFVESPRVVNEMTQTIDASRPPYSTRYPDLARLAENPDVNMIWRNLVYQCGMFLVRDRGNQDLRGNLITDEASGTTDVAGRRLPWKLDPAVMDRIGFRPIPVEEIGLYQDQLRASWPTAEKP